MWLPLLPYRKRFGFVLMVLLHVVTTMREISKWIFRFIFFRPLRHTNLYKIIHILLKLMCVLTLTLNRIHFSRSHKINFTKSPSMASPQQQLLWTNDIFTAISCAFIYVYFALDWCKVFEEQTEPILIYPIFDTMKVAKNVRVTLKKWNKTESIHTRTHHKKTCWFWA